MPEDVIKLLKQLGWNPHSGIDHSGTKYEGWTNGNSYFHIYHESKNGNIIRPNFKKQK